MYVLGVQETSSQHIIGKLCVSTLADRIVISIQDGQSSFSTSIYLLPVDAETVINNIKQALNQLEAKMIKPKLTAKQTLAKHILDFGYCDIRPYSTSLDRFWSVLYQCPKCSSIAHYAKELKLKQAITYANNLTDCVDCE